MRKLFVKLFFAIIGVTSLSSCNTYYYQVFSVETNGAQQVDNSLVFENEDCKVCYNLWSNNGKVNFAFFNKTDKDIFINLGQTFFIKNGFAIDYYQGRTYSTQRNTLTSNSFTIASAASNGIGIWSKNIYMEDASVLGLAKTTKSVNSSSYAITTEEKEIVCVPAKCYKTFAYYEASPSQVITCNNDKDYPTNIANVAEYNQSNTPLTITNRIAYGFQKDDVAEKHIENTFWISSIKNYSQNAATEKVIIKDECDQRKSNNTNTFSIQQKINQFKIGGPDKFYIFYTKSL